MSPTLHHSNRRDPLADLEDLDDYLPNYDAATSDAGSVLSSSTGPRRLFYVPSLTDSRPSSPVSSLQSSVSPANRRLPSTPGNGETYLYTYSVKAGQTPLLFTISVEPLRNQSDPRKHKFKLCIKTGPVERVLSEPVTMNLSPSINPRTLDFRLFLYPGKSSLPANCLWSYRVWLCVDQGRIEHRLFGEDEMWVGKDPEFGQIENSSFARLVSLEELSQSYQGVVGRANTSFIATWKHVKNSDWTCSVEYDSGGVGTTLFDDLTLTLDCEPRNVTFLIYTVPISTSIPPLANHKLRVWLRSPTLASDTSSSFSHMSLNDSFIYQRIWKNDSFKLGKDLEYGRDLERRFCWGVRVGMPGVSPPPAPPPLPPHPGLMHSGSQSSGHSGHSGHNHGSPTVSFQQRSLPSPGSPGSNGGGALGLNGTGGTTSTHLQPRRQTSTNSNSNASGKGSFHY
ncbi:hypothetical protein DL96DRAFT_1609778 [Flagelloscypha sp. PMI_526]|nr:hypothetical protein DL96DRAFT_1609778 [Flagelloscypha sp. PMI_526]